MPEPRTPSGPTVEKTTTVAPGNADLKADENDKPNEQVEEAKPEEVTLSIATSFVDHFQGHAEVNGERKSFTIDAAGTKVPASVADDLVKQAKESNIKLKKKGS